MSDSSNLSALRAELKHKLADGTYDPLAERIIKFPRMIFPRLPAGDIPSFLILSVCHFLLVCLLFILDGSAAVRGRLLITFPTAIILWIGSFLYARLYRQLYRVLSEYVVDALSEAADIQHLSRWLSIISNTWLTLLFMVTYLPFITPYMETLLSIAYGKFNLSGTIANLGAHLVNGFILHHLLALMVFPLILSGYQVDLRELDPGSSPSILHLSIVIRNSSYQLSAYATLYTLFMFYALRMPIFPVAFLYMIPLLGIFIFRQIALSRIVARARGVTLERLYLNMEKLDIERHFDDPALCNQFKSMADYYDRVKHADSGVFDLRSGWMLFNSLILPSLAFILTQYDRMVAFVSELMR